ncbi:MAG: CDP-diacylglycerol--glycerol-3-phosphate 3-phosphatidyltransferase [Candidatus Omnitrophota bacterium]
MNISNKLTFLRILLAFFCVGFILLNTFTFHIIALCLFIVASLTDWLDGYFARKHDHATDLGKILDPIADKILIIGVFAAFVEIDLISVWMVIAILLREFIVTSLRLYSLRKGVVLAAQAFGKHKTASQISGVLIIFTFLLLSKTFPQAKITNFLYTYGIPIVMWYILIITLFSGFYYFWVNRQTIKTF